MHEMWSNLNFVFDWNLSAAATPTTRRSIARWVAPTIKALNRRKRKDVEDGKFHKDEKRSGFIEWNYSSEIYAYNARLNENFRLELLVQAFTQRSYIAQEEHRQRKVGIEEPVLNLKDNFELAKKGEEIVHKYVTAFVRSHFPLYPDAGVTAVKDYLCSREKLAFVSSQLGNKEIILTSVSILRLAHEIEYSIFHLPCAGISAIRRNHGYHVVRNRRCSG